jgi:hypothetical protein
VPTHRMHEASVCVYASVFVCKCASMYVYVCMCVCTCVCWCLCACVYACVHVCMCVCLVMLIGQGGLMGGVGRVRAQEEEEQVAEALDRVRRTYSHLHMHTPLHT